MSEHSVTVVWQHQGGDVPAGEYSRSHEWVFEGGVRVPASSAPSFKGDPARVDSEEAFVAALSSCHMLTFLFLAARRGLGVLRYTDAAVGHLAKGPDGKRWMTEVVLRPSIVFSGAVPETAVLDALHDEAHAGCFIANSVKTEVRIDPPVPTAA